MRLPIWVCLNVRVHLHVRMCVCVFVRVYLRVSVYVATSAWVCISVGEFAIRSFLVINLDERLCVLYNAVLISVAACKCKW